MTLIELLIVVAIISILASMAAVSFQRAQIRARVSAGKSQLRMIGGALELFHVDRGAYPAPVAPTADDPFGVVASNVLRDLTTPIAYLDAGAFRDPFGAIQMQFSSGAGSAAGMGGDPFGLPTPSFNTGQSLLYFYYPHFSRLVDEPALDQEGFAVISVGPDTKDSFIAYLPFPDSLPSGAGAFGIDSTSDTIYDPTNGAISGGDIAFFGGSIPARQLVGGGGP